jgi:hypothetical protein
MFAALPALPSGLLPGLNLFGQNIANVGLVSPVQAAFTVTQALTSAPLSMVNAAASAINTLLTGSVNSLNTLVLGVLGAPLGSASGVNISSLFPFNFGALFPGLPSGIFII